jgi:hypothetical protein
LLMLLKAVGVLVLVVFVRLLWVVVLRLLRV